jgi:hypothetical protein
VLTPKVRRPRDRLSVVVLPQVVHHLDDEVQRLVNSNVAATRVHEDIAQRSTSPQQTISECRSEHERHRALSFQLSRCSLEGNDISGIWGCSSQHASRGMFRMPRVVKLW